MLDDKIKIFFARSKLRLKVLNEINKKPQIASFLSKDLKKHREVISRIFADLQKQNLAKCKNPKDPHFRYYNITNKGKLILKEIKEKYN
jgi:DNA-binding PadR family transcriptional regulator